MTCTDKLLEKWHYDIVEWALDLESDFYWCPSPVFAQVIQHLKKNLHLQARDPNICQDCLSRFLRRSHKIKHEPLWKPKGANPIPGKVPIYVHLPLHMPIFLLRNFFSIKLNIVSSKRGLSSKVDIIIPYKFHLDS